MKTKAQTQLISYAHIVRIQSALMVLAVMAICAYVYVVGISVTYAVAEKELAQQKKVLSAEVLALESQYLTQSQNFSMSTDAASGLVTVLDKSFIQTGRLGSAQPIVVAN